MEQVKKTVGRRPVIGRVIWVALVSPAFILSQPHSQAFTVGQIGDASTVISPCRHGIDAFQSDARPSGTGDYSSFPK